MESIKKYIDRDDSFFLYRVNGLDLYLKFGITLFVSDIFGPNFQDMTLIQYAISRRKPKTLKDMLDTALNKCKLPFIDIIIPKTSNTKGNLLLLAVEFGSKNDDYEICKEPDNSCLEVILQFIRDYKSSNKNNSDFSVDIEDVNGETPLMRAIYHMNVNAIILLLQNGADILHKSKINDYLEIPLRSLFLNAKYVQDLMMITNHLSKQTKELIFKPEFYQFLKDNKLIAGILYVEECRKNDISRINLLKEEEEEETPDSHQDQCCVNSKHNPPLRECIRCNKVFCEDCYIDHECYDDD